MADKKKAKKSSPKAPSAPPPAAQLPRTTIPVQDEWFEPGSVHPPITIPVAEKWLIPDLPVAPRPPPLPRIEVVDGQKTPRRITSKRPPRNKA
jgi:hypothetical protein